MSKNKKQFTESNIENDIIKFLYRQQKAVTFGEVISNVTKNKPDKKELVIDIIWDLVNKNAIYLTKDSKLVMNTR